MHKFLKALQAQKKYLFTCQKPSEYLTSRSELTTLPNHPVLKPQAVLLALISPMQDYKTPLYVMEMRGRVVCSPTEEN